MLSAYLSKLSTKEHKTLVKELGLRRALPKGYSKFTRAQLATEIGKHVRLTPDNSIERNDVKRVSLNKAAEPEVKSDYVPPKKVRAPKQAKLADSDVAEEPSAAPVAAAAPASGKVKKVVAAIEAQSPVSEIQQSAESAPQAPAKKTRLPRLVKAAPAVEQ